MNDENWIVARQLLWSVLCLSIVFILMLMQTKWKAQIARLSHWTQAGIWFGLILLFFAGMHCILPTYPDALTTSTFFNK